MRLRSTSRWLSVVIAAAPLVGAGPAPSAPPSLERYLRTTVGLDDGQLADMRKGRVVTKVLKTDLDRDVAVFGIVAVHVSRAVYDARLRDTTVIAGMHAQDFGVIHDPPAAADLRDISVDDDRYRDLKSCRVGDCNFKLPVESMTDFADHVDWDSRDERRQVDSIVHSDALRFVTAYRDSGSAAMVRYDDGGGVRSGDVFASLLAASTSLPAFPAELRDYLLSYPANQPAGARDVLFWSKDHIPRLRPTIVLTHMVVYTPDANTQIVARKQIFADHYFEGAFEVLAAFDAPDAGGEPAIYLVDVRRYRFDHLPSGGLFNLRGRVRNHLADLLRSDLDGERAAAEASRQR